jgi:hypothetical protein
MLGELYRFVIKGAVRRTARPSCWAGREACR